MKKLIVYTLILSVAFITNAQEHNTDATKIALDGYSPVSYVDLNLAQRGLKAYKSEYRGMNYYFTSSDQKNTFDKNPDKYLPQYGGWCATGIAVGAKFRTDPNKFLVENGKLYLFLNDLEVDAKQLWIADSKGMKKKAEINWPGLKSK
ncbi:MAG: YHS domain-containing (seleno)protein [Cyclobacteriaceae bacterium]